VTAEPEVTAEGLDSDKLTKYFTELGRFVTVFAGVEGMVFVHLAELVGLSLKEATAVTSGAKVDACMSFIKRVHEARSVDVPKQIDAAMQQLSLINKLRNDILHQGTQSGFTVTNELRALPKRVIAYTVSADLLIQATHDLVKIMFLMSGAIKNVSSPSPAEMGRIKSVLESPWLFKPPPPNDPKLRLFSPDGT